MVNMAGNERGSQAEFFYELRGGGWKGASTPLAPGGYSGINVTGGGGGGF